MAVNGAMDAPRRRLVFGVNVIVQAVLAVAVAAAIIWAGGHFKAQADLTGRGSNSLSTRTVQLLKGLNQNIRITGIFAEPDKRDEIGQKRRRQMRDLLDLYEAAGGARVTTALIDPSLEKGKTDKLLQHLLELPAYKDEAQPHQEVLSKFADVNKKIQELMTTESSKLDELTKNDAQLARNRNLGIIRNNLRVTTRDTQQIQEKVQDLTHGGEIPRFGQAVKEVRDYANNVQLLLQDVSKWMTGDGLTTTGLTPELRTFFEQSASRYEPVLADTKTLLDQAKDLKDVKVEELYSGLTRWRTGPPVLVENEREARLVPDWDVWVRPSEPGMPLGPDGDDRVFAGEAAISSAILALTQTQKTAVIFTRFGGQQLLKPDFSQMNPMMQQMPQAPFQDMNALLEKSNFTTEEWDVAKDKTPPAVADAARTVYVVFPPTPPPQRNPMQPSPEGRMTPEDRKAVLDAVQAAGLAVFLAGWMPPPSPMPGMTGSYEYADYLKSTWGVDVLFNNLALHFTGHPDPDKRGLYVPAGRQPQLLTTGQPPDGVVEFTDDPISAPLKTDRGAFVLAAPLAIPKAESMPAGVKIGVIAQVRSTKDVWATSDIGSIEDQLKKNQGVRPGPADIPTPFPVALNAANDKGQKVVVFSSEHFASDAIAQATGLQQMGRGLVLGALYPANSDLFINALHWLTGEANRIAVGPRTGDVPRLKQLDEAWAARLPVLLVGIWPALALVVGVCVWAVRRR